MTTAPPSAPRLAAGTGDGFGTLVSRRYLALTIGLTLSMGLNAFEIIGAATAMPAVLADVGGVAFYGAAAAAPLVASLLAAPFGGRLADRFGALRPLVGAFALFALGLVGASVATSMPTVAAGRFVQGLGAGALTTLQLVIVARYYELTLRPKMLAVMSSAFIVPGIVGPSIAAAIAAGPGWRWVFGGLLPLLLVAVVLLVPTVARRERAAARSSDVVAGDASRVKAELIDGAAPAGVGADDVADRPVRWWGPVALSLGLAVAILAGSTAQVVWVPVAIVAAVVAIVGMRVTLPPGTLAAAPPPVPAAVRSALFAALAYLTFEAFLPLALTTVRGEPLLLASFPLTVAAFCWTTGSWVQARVPPHRRPRAAMIGGLLEAGGIALALTLLIDAVPFWVAYPAAALSSFGMGLGFTIDQAVAVEWASRGREGEASGAVQLANLLGGAAGTGFTAVALAWLASDLRWAIGASFVVTAIAGLAAAHAALRLPSTRPPAPDPATP